MFFALPLVPFCSASAIWVAARKKLTIRRKNFSRDLKQLYRMMETTLCETKSRKVNSINVDRYFRVINIGSRILGCNLLDSGPVSTRKSDIFLRLLTLSMMCFVLIPSLVATAEFATDLQSLCEVISNVLSFIESLYILVNLYYQEDKYKNLVRKIRQEFWSEPLSPILFQHFRGFERIFINISMFVALVTLPGNIGYCTFPLWIHNFNMYADINAKRRTPLIATYHYDHRTLGSSLAVLIFVLGTSIYAFICMHFCAKLRLMQFKLNAIGASTSTKEFTEIIREHRYLIRFAKDVEDLYSPMLLLHILLSTLLICLTMFKITSMTLQDGALQFTVSAVYFSATFFQIFVFCWMANEVFAVSDNLALAAYNSHWYEAPIHIRRGISLIILRAYKPIVLTAGKFFPVTLASFGSVCSTAVSYYTLLRSIQ